MIDGGLISEVFSIFHRFSLKMGVLLHPHSGLLWLASPPFFFVVNVTFAKKLVSVVFQ